MMKNALTKTLRAGCLTAFGAVLFWHGAEAGAVKQPVLVELFTSQGCSSCPPADKILGEIQKRDDVVALSFSIDYWDYIGWRDTLARRENTLRQQAYEKVLASHRVYTPQMVIDGVKDVVGNQRKNILDVLERRLGETQGKRLPVSLAQVGDAVQVRIGTLAGVRSPATVWLAHTLSARTVNITTGENSGREITYHNVVRGFAAVGKWSGDPISLDLPAQGQNGELTDGVAVWVQADGVGPVLGVAQIRVTPTK
ncbi:MAG: DUF1223 domain-containing protein [Alphaproteobacteria bacterium]|nr:DUF1223 domain-containing protein [Alphaproteobacteria bacterium]